MNTSPRIAGFGERLDHLSPWAFTGSLYLLRWVVILPVSYAVAAVGVPGGKANFKGAALTLLTGFIFIAPIMETLVECTLPYWLLGRLGWSPGNRRPWLFVILSAWIMAVLHLSAWPAALFPSLITGGFLAYTYGHFAPLNQAQAFLHTWAFHAGINIVGWTMLMLA